MPVDARLIYMGGGVIITLLLVLVVLLMRGSGPQNPTGLWEAIKGYRTHAVVLGVILLRYSDRRGWIDQQLFTDLQDLLIGGGAITYLAKMNRIQDEQKATKEVAQVAAAAAKVTAGKTEQILQQTTSTGGGDGKTPAATL